MPLLSDTSRKLPIYRDRWLMPSFQVFIGDRFHVYAAMNLDWFVVPVWECMVLSGPRVFQKDDAWSSVIDRDGRLFARMDQQGFLWLASVVRSHVARNPSSGSEVMLHLDELSGAVQSSRSIGECEWVFQRLDDWPFELVSRNFDPFAGFSVVHDSIVKWNSRRNDPESSRRVGSEASHLWWCDQRDSSEWEFDNAVPG